MPFKYPAPFKALQQRLGLRTPVVGLQLDSIKLLFWSQFHLFIRILRAQCPLGYIVHPDTKSLQGLLLYGPPGCGKTHLSIAIAKECNVNVLCVQAPQLLSKVVGHTEKALKDLFARSRSSAPCFIIIEMIEVVLYLYFILDHVLVTS